MTVPVRLAAFALALVLVFAGGVGLGRAVGPSTEPSMPMPAGGMGQAR